MIKNRLKQSHNNTFSSKKKVYHGFSPLKDVLKLKTFYNEQLKTIMSEEWQNISPQIHDRGA